MRKILYEAEMTSTWIWWHTHIYYIRAIYNLQWIESKKKKSKQNTRFLCIATSHHSGNGSALALCFVSHAIFILSTHHRQRKCWNKNESARTRYVCTMYIYKYICICRSCIYILGNIRQRLRWRRHILTSILSERKRYRNICCTGWLMRMQPKEERTKRGGNKEEKEQKKTKKKENKYHTE